MYKNKKFDYDLWTTNDDGVKRYWVRIRATQEVVEVDLKTLRFLRAEEKKIYRAIEEARNNAGTVLSYEVFEDEEVSGEWLIDDRNHTDTILNNIMIESFLNQLTRKQKDVFLCVFLKGESQSDYAQRKKVSARAIRYIIIQIKKKAKIFFK